MTFDRDAIYTGLSNPTPDARQILTVSTLTQKIKLILEDSLDFIWIAGEISNFKIAASGHAYFTLKDTGAQIGAVLFRPQLRALKFSPGDGAQVMGLGRIGVYAPRGTYQVIFEYLEPFGAGALQQAFEALKTRLSEEGLFAAARKRPLPALPRKISVITSLSGAVWRDICKVAWRRFPRLAIQLVPAAVQGAAAVSDLVQAVELANRDASADLIILARGGGSLEDLQAFNSEPVARAIAASRLPVVSAVGHETDLTIADMVADLRAPTPSAAAEMIIPSRAELAARLARLTRVLETCWRNYAALRRARVGAVAARLAVQRRRIVDARLRIDESDGRLRRAAQKRMDKDHSRLQWLGARLNAAHPQRRLDGARQRLGACLDRLYAAQRLWLAMRRQRLAPLSARLTALSPLAVLARGYSITRTLPDHRVVRRAGEAAHEQTLEILLARGRLKVRVM